MSSLTHEEKTELLTDIDRVINFVANLKTDAGHSPNGQALAVLHTDLRKCRSWAKMETESVDGDPDVEAHNEPIQEP